MFTVQQMRGMTGVDIYVDDVADHVKQLEKAIKTYEEVTERFLYAIAEKLEEALDKRGGEVKSVDYKTMELLEMGKVDGFTTFALVHPEVPKELTPGEINQTVVVVIPKQITGATRRDSQGRFVNTMRTLAELSPWPVTALPQPYPTPQEARLVFRNVRLDEYVERVDQLVADDRARAVMEGRGILSPADSPERARQKILARQLAEKLVALEDIGWRVLRQEFGIGDDPVIKHWTPALTSLQDDVKEEAENFIRYLLGDEKALEATKLDGMGNARQMDRIVWFQEMLGNMGKAMRAARVRST